MTPPDAERRREQALAHRIVGLWATSVIPSGKCRRIKVKREGHRRSCWPVEGSFTGIETSMR